MKLDRLLWLSFLCGPRLALRLAAAFVLGPFVFAAALVVAVLLS